MTDFRLGTFDKTILGLSLVGALVTGYGVFNEHLVVSHFVKGRSTSEPIGRVASAESDVRRKMGQSILWYHVDKDEVLFENDSLYTGSDSKTSIAIGDKSEINLGPNSLVVLQKRNQELQVDLQVGTLVAELKKGERMNIVHQGEVARVEAESNNTLQVSKSDQGNLKLSSLSGGSKVQVRDSIQKLSSEEEVEVDQKLKVEKHRLDVLLRSPSEGEELWVGPEEAVRFQWTRLSAGENYYLQVSSDRNFNQLVLNEQMISDSFAAKDLSLNRPYYWRLSRKVGDLWAPVSRAGSFRAYKKSAPQPLFPLAGWSVEVEEAAHMRFKWKRKVGVDQYRIQVAKDPEFNAVVMNEVTGKDFVQNLRLEPAVYYWRVKAEDIAPLANLWGNGGDFSILSAEPEPAPVIAEDVELPAEPVIDPQLQATKLPKPKLPQELPAKVSKLEIGNEQQIVELQYAPGEGRDPASLRERLINPPKMSWKVPKGQKGPFVVEVSNTPEFSKKLVEKETAGSQFTWRDVEPGEYFWRVRQKPKGGSDSSVSDVGELKVRLPAPGIEREINHVESVEDPAKMKDLTEVEVSWAEVPLANSYDVILAKNSDFSKKTLKLKSNQPGAKIRLKKSGAYYMKVAAMNKSGRRISSYSPPAKINFEKKLMMKAPSPELPSNGTTVVRFAGQESSPVAFSWSDVKHAKDYHLQLASDPQFKQLIEDVKVPSTSWVYDKAPPNGKIYWRVRAEYDEYESDWSSVRSFEGQVAEE